MIFRIYFPDNCHVNGIRRGGFSGCDLLGGVAGSLFVAQGDDGIDLGCTARGYVAGQGSYGDEDN